jgi:hypothetical protein
MLGQVFIMGRKKSRALARKPKRVRPRPPSGHSIRSAGNSVLVGIPAILLGFVIIGYGLLISDVASLLIAGLVFLAGLLLVWKG